MKKKCPRCISSFECKVDDIKNCQCFSFKLSSKSAAIFKEQNWDCLCQKCLSDFERLSQQAVGVTFPRKKDEFIEGKHFNYQDSYLVFTELYHYLRGTCCKNNCKHCIYGFKNEQNGK